MQQPTPFAFLIAALATLQCVSANATTPSCPNGVCVIETSTGVNDDEVSMLQVKTSSHAKLKADAPCVPYGEEACMQAAKRLGLTLGGNGAGFKGDYTTKGCYSYKSGKYKGAAYFGTGGGESARKAAVGGDKFRPSGYEDCPDVYNVVGQGQCTDSDGKFGHIGWAECTHGSGRCDSLDTCKTECSAHSDCAAVSYYQDSTGGFCWMYEKMDTPYTKTNSEYSWYDCHVKEQPVSCTCKTPNQGFSGKNGFECSDGTSSWCASSQKCMATASFRKGDLSTVCKADCTCKTPNQGAAGKNGFKCSDGHNAYCRSNQVCVATTPFVKNDGLGSACRVMCYCSRPNAGTAGKNGFWCTDGTKAYCRSDQRCFATSFPKGEFDKGCSV